MKKLDHRWFGKLTSIDGSDHSMSPTFQLLVFDVDLKLLKQYHRIKIGAFYNYFTNIESLDHLGIGIYEIKDRDNDYCFVDFAIYSEVPGVNFDTDTLTVIEPRKLILIKDLIKDIGDTFFELLKNDIPFLKTLLITYLNENV